MGAGGLHRSAQRDDVLARQLLMVSHPYWIWLQDQGDAGTPFAIKMVCAGFEAPLLITDVSDGLRDRQERRSTNAVAVTCNRDQNNTTKDAPAVLHLSVRVGIRHP